MNNDTQSVMFSRQGITSALRCMNQSDKKTRVNPGDYTRIPGSSTGVRNDILLNGQAISSNGRTVRNFKPVMLNMDTKIPCVKKRLGEMAITIIEIDNKRYLYQKNEKNHDTLCCISQENKRPVLESKFIGGDHKDFANKMLDKAAEIIARACDSKAEAGMVIKDSKSGGVNKDVKVTAEMYANANETIANIDAELKVANNIKACYQENKWDEIRESIDKCNKKLKDFVELSGNVSIEPSAEKVTIKIGHFNQLLTIAQAIDHCLEDKSVKDFITVNRGDIECKVISSDFELVSGCKMNLRIYPNGIGGEKGKYLSVFFDQDGKIGKLPNPTNGMKVTLLNQADEEKSMTINMASGKDQFLRKTDMLDLELLKGSEQSNSDFLKDDTLVIHCQFLDSIPLTTIPVSS